MSSLYVVPGASPSSAIAVTFGNNTLITTTLTTSASEICSVNFSLLNPSSLIIDSALSITTTSNTVYNITFYLTLDGNKMNSTDFIDSVQGAGHYAALNITGYNSSVAIGSHTVKLWALTNAPAATISCGAVTINGSANLI